MPQQRMADFLTAVKSVRDRNPEDDAQPDLLTAVGSRSLRESTRAPQDVSSIGLPDRSRSFSGTVKESTHSTTSKDLQDFSSSSEPAQAQTPSEALQILRSQPSRDSLTVVLKQLRTGGLDRVFILDVPGPSQAQIINTLLNDIVPTFWPTLEPQDQALLVSCLENVAGLNAVVARLRLLASQKTSPDSIKDLLQIATKLFETDKMIMSTWERICGAVEDDRKRAMLWTEFVNIIGSGKVIAAVAQAEDAVKAASKSTSAPSSWLASGSEYCVWLGRSVAKMAFGHKTEEEDSIMPDAASLLAKALHLGHSGHLLAGLLHSSFATMATADRQDRIKTLVRSLPNHAQRTFIEHLLRWHSSTIAPAPDIQSTQKGTEPRVSAIAALLWNFADGNDTVLQAIQTHLTDATLSSTISLTVRRSCLTVLASKSEDDALQQLLEKAISTFSSTLFIAHASVAQQECLAKTILIVSGYVHRREPMSLLMTARSSGHMQGVSNRLDSSNARARWLGMVVGTALSKLVDKPGSQMDFGTDDMKSEEATWYADLVNLDDKVGKLEDFDKLLASKERLQEAPSTAHVSQRKSKKKPATIDGKPVFGPKRPPAPVQTKIIGERVTEITDDGSDEEDGLKPYAKPDSDPEDSDEDATLVNRNKAKAPVYIRDLMAGLRDDKTYDRFTLALRTAASLIRRKTSFGKEVTDHAEELAGMLCNLQDPFDTDEFDDLRLQALVAVLLSDVKVIAPLLARQAFAEGYSIAQRCVILSALGLGGRELAGFKFEDEDYNPKLSNPDFPSKKLPPHLHAIYSANSLENQKSNRLEAVSHSLENQIIQPLALQAADQSTAHLNAVKVHTFSSRMEVEKARTRRKAPPNDLSKNFGETFFFPLANRYQHEIATYGTSSVYASAPFVLVTFIKTLALLLHASGPATLGLPQISSEMWDLLLSLRVQALGDISILQAVLFALLTLLEVNTDKQRIVSEHPKQLMETQQWVDMVFERMGSTGLVDEVGEGNGEEAKVRTLAAGVLMKCREIIEMYQRQLIGYEFS